MTPEVPRVVRVFHFVLHPFEKRILVCVATGLKQRETTSRGVGVVRYRVVESRLLKVIDGQKPIDYYVLGPRTSSDKLPEKRKYFGVLLRLDLGELGRSLVL